MKARYLIIGNGAGGIGAVEAIREVDRKGSIALVSDEPYPAYSRPMIAKYLSGERGLDDILYRPEGFYDVNGVVRFLGRKVAGISLKGRRAAMDNGDEVRWDKLLLATGGSPIIPKGLNPGLKGVYTFTTLDDARAIGEALSAGSRVVVVGGGLIGISAAEALRKRGAEVTIVELKGAILNTVLDGRGSAIAEAAVSRHGVKIVTGRTVSKIAGKEKVSGVVLDSGERLTADMVVLA
ncbi:MAG: FAD-dependent oxidoreductase, partial [Dehalococcoidia bacterium]